MYEVISFGSMCTPLTGHRFSSAAPAVATTRVIIICAYDRVSVVVPAFFRTAPPRPAAAPLLIRMHLYYISCVVHVFAFPINVYFVSTSRKSRSKQRQTPLQSVERGTRTKIALLYTRNTCTRLCVHVSRYFSARGAERENIKI